MVAVGPVILTREDDYRQVRRIREDGGARGAFEAEMASQGVTPRVEVSVCRVYPSPARLAGWLLPPGPVIRRTRTMYADDRLVQLATSWIPAELAEGTPMTEEDPGEGGIYSRLADAGHPVATFTEVTRFRPATREEDLLDLQESGGFVVAIQRTARDSEGRVLEVCDMALPPHMWQLVKIWEADET